MEKKEKKPAGYWNDYDNCYNEAKKYNKRSDFSFYSRGAYASALKHKWLDRFVWLKSGTHEGEDFWIYAYEDKVNKVAYVGLTYRERRHTEHKNKNDKVCKYFKGNVPEPRILINDIGAEDSSYYEDWYKKAYVASGWTLLNKAKTGVGSSSHGSAIRVWTYEHCKEEAEKCNDRGEFKTKCPKGYSAALRNGWLDEFYGKSKIKPNGYWTYEHCKEEADKYKTRRQFKINGRGAYIVSLDNGWLDEWFGDNKRKPKGYWTYEHCKEEAIKYDRRVDFCDNCHTAYAVSLENGWVDEWFGDKWESLSSVTTKWDYESCKEEAKKYSTRSVFSKKANGAYDSARRNGWLDEFFPKAA